MHSPVGPGQRPYGNVSGRQLLVAVCIIGAILAAIVLLMRLRGDASPNLARLTPVSGTVPGSDTAPASAPSASQSIGAFAVRTLDGSRAPIAVAGTPTVVMVSSVTCAWCKRALRDMGELANGRPLTRLTLLTLEGAADGAPMLAKEGITGARLVGPVGSTDQVLLTFRYPGTPTFVAIDRNGRVVRSLPGYPGRDGMARWFAVMVGDADVP